ncbi:MAG: hypothetical protein WCT12_09920 [Verrucomicrobiota bacterium]
MAEHSGFWFVPPSHFVQIHRFKNMPKPKLKTLAEKFAVWLTAQGKAEGAQTFDKTPQGFAEKFFEQTDSIIPVEVLEQGLWWWRHANETDWHKIFGGKGNPDDPDAFQIFIQYHQRSAFNYELMARITNRYTWAFGLPWILCSQEQREYLTSLYPTDTTSSIWQPPHNRKAGWVEIPAREINLKAHDVALMRQFMDEVARLRRQHGIEKPKPGKGVRRKPISFLPIELMDRRYYLHKQLNDSERSQVSKAERAYNAASKAAGIDH